MVKKKQKIISKFNYDAKNLPKLKKVIKKLENDPYNYANKLDIDDLVEILAGLSHFYYNTDTSLVSDDVYDILIEVLSNLDPTHDFLKEVGSKISKDEVQLPYFMASLDKIKPDTNILESWLKKYSGNYVISDKLDGVSGLLHKTKNKLKLYTRGNGEYGQDITHLIPYVFSKNIDFTDLPVGAAIRGELIISKADFKTISATYKNARNAVAGLVNSKTIRQNVANVSIFVAYSVIHPKLKAQDQMKQLKKWKFETVFNKTIKKIDNNSLSKLLIDRRENSKYEVDGIVVYDNSTSYTLPKTNPKYAFAFKTVMTDQIVEAKVLDVEWNCSKHGYLKPRIRISPVHIVGVDIEYATAFNAKFVNDNVLGPGATVKLVRSGDVIPHIMEVLKPASSNKPKMPDIPYKWNKSGVDILVKDIHGACKDSISIKKIATFFTVLGVKYLSEGLVTKFVDNGYNSIVKILKANKTDLYEIDGFGKTIIDKIYTNITEAFKTVTMIKLMAATTIFKRGLGQRKIKLIFNEYPDIMNQKWNTETMIEKLVLIDGFDKITANQFVDNLPEFKKFLLDLEKVADLKHITKPNTTKKITTNQTMKDHKIVFTGFRDKDLESKIEEKGGKVNSSVSKNTTIVVYADKSGSKYQKAILLNLKTMTKDQFIKKYM